MSSSHRPALGRGLGALIPQTSAGAVDGEESGVAMVDIDLITPNPEQPRMHFDQQALQELADSIREHGVLQPIVVTQ
ncbi:MAG TPA: ParB N-terminal domain-containing protein, partial [Dehalococcoidia bacterium]|nr:ParB N-terminal domain-containing protein [Dehalococcoidia bacterium]